MSPHRTFRPVLLLAALVALPGCATVGEPRDTQREPAFKRFLEQTIDDHRRHYQPDVLADLLPPLMTAGALANTGADRWIRDTYQQDVRSDTSDNIARVFLHAGDAAQNKISLPLYSLTMMAAGYSGYENVDSPAATWAGRSLRANILGGPQAFVLTYALGSHRPDVGNSNWIPWRDNDGVSGHSFYGAVPFLTAARMSEHPGWRYGFYALSVLPAFARINDNQHYTSQAVMGWSIAWLTTRTIATGENDDDIVITPLLLPDGAYVAVSWQF